MKIFDVLRWNFSIFLGGLNKFKIILKSIRRQNKKKKKINDGYKLNDIRLRGHKSWFVKDLFIEEKID